MNTMNQMHHKYESGFERSSREGKPDHTFIPTWLLDELSLFLADGAARHGRDNWKKAGSITELEDAQAALLRHARAFVDGKVIEQHDMATIFNIMLCKNIKRKLNE